jgi:RNA-directed DNA polymerase
MLVRPWESERSKPEMSGKSDGDVVPEKLPNKELGAPKSAEAVEERSSTKGNSCEPISFRTQGRVELEQGLARIRQVAKGDKEVQFTTLWHHVYNVARLQEAFLGLKRKAAPGVDDVTWQDYRQGMGPKLQHLSERLQRGAYRPLPVRRVYIDKLDGRQRALGVTATEDKLVQRATVKVLNAVYEEDFVDFSYGFRPGRSQHNALDALYVGLAQRKVNWVLDADIRGFFDSINHEWLLRFIEHRIADKRVLRHIKKWLHAGVLEEGEWKQEDEGTPQGGNISPLLANIYLHYAFDLWANVWRSRARGDVIIVRYADDFVVGFQHRETAEQFLRDLTLRFAKFGLELHPDKTRLLEFGRFAAERRSQRNAGKPETFDFLGFTHICATTRKTGAFVIYRRTRRKSVHAKLVAIRRELRRRLHHRRSEVGAWLASVLRGHFNYYGVPLNYRSLHNFHAHVVRMWLKTLRRRSQRSTTTWVRMRRLIDHLLPRPSITHPWPYERLRV